MAKKAPAPAFPSALSRIRRDRELTLEELADRVNTTKATVSKHELGQRKITREWAIRYANALDCHWTEIYGDPPPLNPRERAFVDLFRGLGEADQRTVFDISDALAKRRKEGTNDG